MTKGLHEKFAVDFKDFLEKRGYDLARVMVMRHRPMESALRRVLPWLAAEQPTVYNAFQCTQRPDAEKALMKADIVASFSCRTARLVTFLRGREVLLRQVLSPRFSTQPLVHSCARCRPRGSTGWAPLQRRLAPHVAVRIYVYVAASPDQV